MRNFFCALLFITLPCFAHQDPPESFELNEIYFVGAVKGVSGEWVAYIRVPDGEVLKAREGVWISPGISQVVKITENKLYIKVRISAESEEQQYKTVVMGLSNGNESESSTPINQP